MSKPPVRRVPSDDCAVEIDGETYYPHEGEWIEVVGTATIAELKSLWAFDRITIELEALEGEPDESEKKLLKLDGYFDELCDWVGGRVKDWNWTDDAGHPLPKPDGSRRPMQLLHAQEVYWIRRLLRGESPLVATNGNGTSPTTSSDTASNPTPQGAPLTKAPSPTKP